MTGDGPSACRYVEETHNRCYTAAEIEDYFAAPTRASLVLAFVTNTGLGLGQGLVTAFFGSKAGIVVLGKTLKEVALVAAGRFARLLSDDDWLVSAPPDLVCCWDDEKAMAISSAESKRADVFVLGVPGQESLDDPPFPSIFAVRRRALNNVQEAACRCADACSRSTRKLNPYRKGFWWSLLIRPGLLTWEQWQRASGNEDFDRSTWREIWHGAQGFSSRTQIATVTFPYVSINTNSNRDLYDIYQCAAGSRGPADAEHVRRLFGIYRDSILGAGSPLHVAAGRNCLVRDFKLTADTGVQVRLGENVVIDQSEIHVTGHAGEVCVIPDGTLIAHCRIFGNLQGDAPNGALIGVQSDSGARFHEATTQTTVFFKCGQRHTVSIPFDFDVKRCLDDPIPGLAGWSFRHLLAGPQPGHARTGTQFML